MVPHKRVSVGGDVRGVASIRQAAAKKQMLPGPGSENSALAKIQAKNIELQNQVKKATEKLGQVQTELKRDTTQRNQTDEDLRAKLGQMEAALNQVQEQLKTEKTQRNNLEERLQKVEKEQTRNSPVNSSLLKQVDDLSTKVKQLEVPSKQQPQLDTAHIQSQIENRVKQSVQSDIKGHVTKVTGLETRFASVEKRLDKLKPDVEKGITQSIQKEIEPLQSKLNQLVTKTDSHKSRIDDLAKEPNNSRVDKLAKELVNVKNQSNSNEKLIDALSKEDVYLLKQDVEAFKKADLSKQISDLQSNFATQKQEITQQFHKVESKLLEKSTVTQYEALEKQVGSVHGRIESYVNERVQQQVPFLIDPTIATMKVHIEQIVQKVKEDIGTHVAENQSALSNLESSTSALIGKLRGDVARANSDASAEVERLRSEVSNLEGPVTEVQLKVEELKSEIFSNNRALRAELTGMRAAPGPSSASTGALALPDHDGTVVQRLNEEFGDRIDRLEKENPEIKDVLQDATEDVREALSKAESAHVTVNAMARSLDLLTKDFKNMGNAMNTLQGEVKSLRTQDSNRFEHTEPAPMPSNTARPDTTVEDPAIEERLQAMNLALRNLTTRYENITTEHLHHSMVHWLAQTYPNAPNFLQDLQRMQQELQPMQRGLRDIGEFVNSIAWMREDPFCSQHLFNLAQKAEAIEQLLRDKDRLGHPATWEDFNGLRNKIEARAAGSATHVSRDELDALRADLETERSDRESLSNKTTLIDGALDQIRRELGKLEGKVDDLIGRKILTDGTIHTLNTQIATLVTRVDDACSKIEQDAETHEQLINDAKTTLGQHGQSLEAHQQLIDKLKANVPAIIITVMELQQFTLDINKNLRSGGFRDFKFSHTFSGPPKP
ncbi:hypothetical protein SLS60_005856 [Paraconiothyrium brasiliense]|uniref:Uncharacterized protein n=1 Tax=Paraconiothyrium brasiliense TaxID=300254 RepID=A0ABR3RDD8_9PLEO